LYSKTLKTRPSPSHTSLIHHLILTSNHHHNITNPFTFKVTDCSVCTTFICNNDIVSCLDDNTLYSKKLETYPAPSHTSLIHYIILINNHHHNITNPFTFRVTDCSVCTTFICNNAIVSCLDANTLYSKTLETYPAPSHTSLIHYIILINNHHHNITNPFTFRVTDCSVCTTFICNNDIVSVVLDHNTLYSKTLETYPAPSHTSLIHYIILINNHHHNITNPFTFIVTDCSVHTTFICNTVTVSCLDENTYYSKSPETCPAP
jgi:hypothetical protein